MYETNDTICGVSNAPFLNSSETTEQTIIKTMYVTVQELPPVASILSVSAVNGNSPLKVQLSPRNCKAGSFPIDRIDWDFGDGSPIITISRYTLPVLDNNKTINTGYFISDPLDVRNIDVVHTYFRNKDTYPVFYPSLTCYSANTNTSDSCCITIGPISFSNSSIEDIHILKARNTNKGNVYAFSENNKVSLNTTTSIATTFIYTQPTIPPLTIRNGAGETQSYFGQPNDNNEFPGIYTPSCEGLPPLLLSDYLVVEDPRTYGTISYDDEVPVKTEKDFFIAP